MLTLPPASFFGQMLARRDVGGLILTDFEYPADLCTPVHAHECSYFSLVLKGTHTQTYEGKVREALPRMTHFHPAGEVHRDRMHQAGTRIFSVEVGSEFLQRIHTGLSALARPADFQGGRLAELMLRLHQETYQRDNASRLAIEGLTLEAL